MNYFRIFYKIILFALVVLVFLVTSTIWRLLIWKIPARRRFYAHTFTFVCYMATLLLSIKVRAINKPKSGKNYLLVGNHLGMIDILVTASQLSALFVTSVELRQTAGLGWLAEMSGCLFVERRSRSNITKELKEIRNVLSQGLSVILYPEGTSTNGERVLPFKKTLMTSAAGTGIAIKPMVLNYRRVNGEPMSAKWRDYVFWYGDQTFAPALLRFFSLRSVEVDLEFCQDVIVHSEEERKIVAGQIQSVVVSKYSKIPLLPGEVSPYSHIPIAE